MGGFWTRYIASKACSYKKRINWYMSWRSNLWLRWGILRLAFFASRACSYKRRI